jgi:hypothetical protein
LFDSITIFFELISSDYPAGLSFRRPCPTHIFNPRLKFPKGHNPYLRAKNVNQDYKIQALTQLGAYLNAPQDPEWDDLLLRVAAANPWFTPQNVKQAVQAIATNFLQENALVDWLSAYAPPAQTEKTVGLVLAGNIPLVGFHDWLCVFMSGHRARVKLSDKDNLLLPFLIKKLAETHVEVWSSTEFLTADDRLGNIDAVVATGSNNTARYFHAYFSKYPHVIRQNRNSIGVLTGRETQTELEALGVDIFSYFGLGCRNVSKIYVPREYDFNPLLETLQNFSENSLHPKYKNNFDYNFTLYLLNQTPFLNNGCLLLKEDASLTARIAAVHYEYYDDQKALAQQLLALKAQIQCITGSTPLSGLEVIPFGKSQSPGLTDYPDGVDVMRFLKTAVATL